jgi:hypothetical protein
MRRFLLVTSCLLATSWLIAACAASGGPPGETLVPDAGSRDARPIPEGSPMDSPTSCLLGTPDTCAACGNICPGKDDPGSKRTCTDSSATAVCGMMCLGEFYDVDGKDDTGCEAEDAPVHDSEATALAIKLPDGNDTTYKSNPLNVADHIYNDDRAHDGSPALRPLGREDWWKVTTVGVGAPGDMAACLGITNFPADDVFEVCISEPASTQFLTSSCKQVKGGAPSTCVSPANGTATGPYLVRVKKISGANTLNAYALFLLH